MKIFAFLLHSAEKGGEKEASAPCRSHTVGKFQNCYSLVAPATQASEAEGSPEPRSLEHLERLLKSSAQGDESRPS